MQISQTKKGGRVEGCREEEKELGLWDVRLKGKVLKIIIRLPERWPRPIVQVSTHLQGSNCLEWDVIGSLIMPRAHLLGWFKLVCGVIQSVLFVIKEILWNNQVSFLTLNPDFHTLLCFVVLLYYYVCILSFYFVASFYQCAFRFLTLVELKDNYLVIFNVIPSGLCNPFFVCVPCWKSIQIAVCHYILLFLY